MSAVLDRVRLSAASNSLDLLHPGQHAGRILAFQIVTRRGKGLSGLFKIKFRDLGLRVVYKTEMVDSRMKIIVVSARSDNQVYREARKAAIQV